MLSLIKFTLPSMNSTLKTYALSSVITFSTIFIISLGGQLASGTITPDNLGWGVVAAVVISALRAAVKGLTENVIVPASSKLKAAFTPKLEK